MATTFPQQRVANKGGVIAQAAPVSPSNEDLPMNLVNKMQSIFGKHPGFRTTHAKGLLVEGTFKPTPEAKTLTTAAHFNNPCTPIIARFSVGGGIPKIPDNDNRASPKGVAIRFQIDKDTHTDLISHSFNGFATRTGDGFLEFLTLLKGMPGTQAELGKFLQANPLANVFFQGPHPNPHNYGTIVYYEPNTHVLTNKDGKKTNLRYRLIPADGEHLFSKDEVPGLQPNYLEDDLLARFPQKPLVLNLQAHIAGPNDDLNDATKPYTSTTFVPVGTITINKVSKNNAAEQQQIAFSPVPEKGGIQGIQSSNDPLIATRKGVYWISADQRRHEKQTEDTGVKMP
ncbi:catalase-like domain-containing protein [Microdochium bolleyi]|uniref:Catalase-like domain-containing protein n=1 Tax=Microdochium bolleyi TaxID=196109 RepID=A0A136INF0_9PEZI|nr:catalase-like domain-containing protein [Microdochium bolleyi]